MNKEIKELLEMLHRITQKKDWGECELALAQDLARWGAKLYEKYEDELNAMDKTL